MTQALPNRSEGLIYPGHYVPVICEEDVWNELKVQGQSRTGCPPVNIKEEPYAYRIEMAVPGVRREDFLVHTDYNMLSISVMHKEPILINERDFTLHEFNYACFDKQIPLPADADLSFISAEYKEGLLRIVIPRAAAVAVINQRQAHIVVY